MKLKIGLIGLLIFNLLGLYYAFKWRIDVSILIHLVLILISTTGIICLTFDKAIWWIVDKLNYFDE